MDSNRRYINCSKFGRSVTNIQANLASDLLETINEYSFAHVKNIIISTGTNDSDTRDAHVIHKDLIRTLEHLRGFPGKIYLSQIPPRMFRKKEVVSQLNQLIANTD